MPEWSIEPVRPERSEAYRAFRLRALAAAPEAFGSAHGFEAAQPPDWFTERTRTSRVFGARPGGAAGTGSAAVDTAGPPFIGMVGFARQAGARQAHKGQLWGLFVEPAWRGRGIGAALVAVVLHHAASLADPPVEQVTLAVAMANAGATALYRRMGFRRYGVEPRALRGGPDWQERLDEALMVRFL